MLPRESQVRLGSLLCAQRTNSWKKRGLARDKTGPSGSSDYLWKGRGPIKLPQNMRRRSMQEYNLYYRGSFPVNRAYLLHNVSGARRTAWVADKRKRLLYFSRTTCWGQDICRSEFSVAKSDFPMGELRIIKIRIHWLRLQRNVQIKCFHDDLFVALW